MKYMATWSIAPENLAAVLERWKTINPMPEEGCKIIERWHVMGTGTGFILFEASDPAALARYNLGWADLADLDIVPVLDEAEAVAAFS
ncbi:MAG: DUF3303 domain-containing protein [Puniceicoccaceae bacterium]